MKLLVVEDYEPLRVSLQQGLSDAGYAVDVTGDGKEAWWFLKDGGYDAVVLDVMLPGRDGLWVLKQLREAQMPTAVLMLTARGELDDRVNALTRGADDYLVKPFAFEELLARVAALLRRRYGQPAQLVQSGPLTVDLGARQARVADQAVNLTASEYGILEVLAYAAGRVVSRDDIRERLYRFDQEPDSNALDVHLSQLRRKLAAAGAQGVIVTRRGLGYILEQGVPC